MDKYTINIQIVNAKKRTVDTAGFGRKQNEAPPKKSTKNRNIRKRKNNAEPINEPQTKKRKLSEKIGNNVEQDTTNNNKQNDNDDDDDDESDGRWCC